MHFIAQSLVRSCDRLQIIISREDGTDSKTVQPSILPMAGSHNKPSKPGLKGSVMYGGSLSQQQAQSGTLPSHPGASAQLLRKQPSGPVLTPEAPMGASLFGSPGFHRKYSRGVSVGGASHKQAHTMFPGSQRPIYVCTTGLSSLYSDYTTANLPEGNKVC